MSNLDVEGERLLDIQVSCLRAAGVDDVYVATGYGANEVSRADVELRHNAAWDAGGSVPSLALFLDLFGGDSDVVIAYGDTLFEPTVIESLVDADDPIAVACLLDRSNSDLGRYREYAQLGGSALLDVGAPKSDKGVRTVFTGLILVKRHRAQAFAEYVKDVGRDAASHLGTLVNHMVHHGVDVAPVVVEHGWAELASDSSYADVLAKGLFLERVLQIHTDWSARARGYDKLQWVNNDSLLSAMVEVAAEAHPSRLLDVGTGSGKVLLGMRQALRTGEFWGLDASDAMMAKIPDREGLHLRTGNAEVLEGIPRGHFDLVTARMVFHHIGDVNRAMRTIREVLAPGGRLVVCEGVPPSLRSVKWYTDMFRYKEDRHTLTETDLIDMFVRNGYEDVRTRTVVMRRASLNNWLDNSGIPQRNIDIIKGMHFDAPHYIADDYEMEQVDGDCLMTWRFAVVVGTAPA